MSLASLLGKYKIEPEKTEIPDGITCEKWKPQSAGSKRCRFYDNSGACVLPSEFMCVEWMIAQYGAPTLRGLTRAPDPLARLRTLTEPKPADPLSALRALKR